MLQNEPKLGKLASKRYALLHLQDQDGNVGYVKIKTKLLKLEGIDKEGLKESIINSGSDITDYVLEKASLLDITNYISEETSLKDLEVASLKKSPFSKVTNSAVISKQIEEDFDNAKRNENENDKISELQRLGKSWLYTRFTSTWHSLRRK